MGWRVGLICRLLHRFSDPLHLAEQRADEEYRQFLLRETGDASEPPGEPEHQELLRLLEEEIGAPLVEISYPATDEVVIARSYVGYRGALQLLERTYTSVVRQSTEENPEAAGI